jgi:phosphoheptose isomerase
MKRSDITDAAIVQACLDFHAFKFTVVGLPAEAPDIALGTSTGAPSKVVMAAMERAYDRGLIAVGVSLRTAWPTPKGLALLEVKP